MSSILAEQQEVQEQPKTSRLRSENLLSALVALLSILTAVVAFHASTLDAQSGDAELLAMQNLIESNTLYLESNADLIYDYQLFDQWIFEEDLERSDYYFNSFTIELQDSIERSDGFDDQYFEVLFADSNELYDLAWEGFFEAEESGDKADNLQLVMMFFALGLAFAGWASLIDETKTSRASFALFSIVMLVIGSITYVYFGMVA